MQDKIYQFVSRIKFVKLSDVIAIFPMCIGFIIAQPIKWFGKKIWLVCERRGEARDNGYWFYKYVCDNHKEIRCIYAIDKNSVDYSKVSKIGEVIQFSSLTHWIYYFAADKLISSQKEGKPNAALCFVIEVYLNARKNRIYLKHGIVKDAQRWIYYDISKLSLICCAAKREYEFIKENFGYPKESIVLTGLCRFDNLLSKHEVKKQILIMPTMREWLRTISTDTLKYEESIDFCKSEYFITWKNLINSQQLVTILEKFDVDLLFYPHPSMQKYLEYFKTDCKHIIIASDSTYEIQQLLMESAVLITDYSSVYFDFAYMKKPVLYYQFDYEKYRSGQYQEGYFSYQEDGFGPVINKEYELLEELNKICERDFHMEDKYLLRAEEFYAFNDTNNSKRTFDAIIKM